MKFDEKSKKKSVECSKVLHKWNIVGEKWSYKHNENIFLDKELQF